MQNTPTTGILITNLGTPDAPTAKALRKYLAEFLWDPRVVEFPRPLWWLILHGIILRIRPKKSAHAYKTVWTEEGSPLLVIAKKQAAAIQAQLGDRVHVKLGMRYGNPSIASALEALREKQVERIFVLPLYPQYSGSTVGSTFDAVAKTLSSWRTVPALKFVNDYAEDEAYIQALANSITQHWQQHPRGQRLLFSFHGIPERYHKKGDPYPKRCEATAQKVASLLDLKPNAWQLVYQSRFGREPWLQPYCDKTLEQLPGEGIKHIDIICPGFSADCLETIEEIAITNKEIFIDAGGETYNYIPALNDNPDHIAGLVRLLAMCMK